MLIEALSIPLMYDLVKTLLGFSGMAIGIYKAVQWVKDNRGKDLYEIKTGITEMHAGVAGLQTEMSKQTDALVNELKEQRQDFRTFYSPWVQAVSTAPPMPLAVPLARAKRSPRPKARKDVRKATRNK